MSVVALKMLFGDPVKFFGLVLGIAFSTLLVNQQVGIMLGLLARSGAIVNDAAEANVWVMDPGVKTLDTVFPLRDVELPRVRGVPGLAWAVPFYKGGGTIRTADGSLEGTVVLGVDDVSLIGIPQKPLCGRLEDLRQADAIALDPEGYRRICPGRPLEIGRTFELNDRRALLVAIVDSSPSFMTGPTIYTRYSQALQFTNNGRNQMSFVLARSAPGATPEAAAAEIHARTGLQARTADEFRAMNLDFIIRNTGIPISFGTVVALGILVGVAVVGLLFNMFVLENLKQFAALKAIGVRNGRLIGMVLLQALTAGTVGYAAGIGAAAAFFEIAGNSPTFRGFYLPWQVAAASACVACGIMVLASLFGLRRVLFVDPAVVFRG